MMKYYERRPTFSAYQFDGTEASVSNLRGLIGKVTRWQITGTRSGATSIEFEREDGIKIEMLSGEYAVSPASGTVYVLSEENFHAKYEVANG